MDRMRIKRDDKGHRPRLAGPPHEIMNDTLMPAVDPVKNTDRHDRPPKTRC